MEELTDGRANLRTDGWVERWMYRWMVGWIDE